MDYEANYRHAKAFSILLILGGLTFAGLIVWESLQLSEAVQFEEWTLRELIEQETEIKQTPRRDSAAP
jgi:hypothetical protein